MLWLLHWEQIGQKEYCDVATLLSRAFAIVLWHLLFAALATYRKCSKHVTPKTTNATKISWWILPLSHQRILTISLILLLLTVCINYYYSSGLVDFRLIFLKIILSFSTYLKTEKKHNFIFTFLWTRPQRNFRRGDNIVFRQCRFSKFGINSIKIYYNENLSKRSQF